MAIEYSGYTTASSVSALDLTLDIPDGESGWGDTLVIIIGNDDASAAEQFNTPTGWIKQFEFGGPLPDCHLALFTRRCDGSEGTTQTIDMVDLRNVWGACIKLRDAGDEFTAIKIGSENVETNSSSHTIPGLDPDNESVIFYALAFDGADVIFTLALPWFIDSTIRAGTTGNEAAGVFGSRSDIEGAVSPAAVVTSSVSDGSVGVQFAFRPFTFFERSLVVAKELEVLLGPSSENWDAASEEGSLRSLTEQAQLSTRVVHPQTEEGFDIQNYVIATFLSYLATSGGSEREKESNAVPGQINVAMADTVARITADVEEEAPIL